MMHPVKMAACKALCSLCRSNTKHSQRMAICKTIIDGRVRCYYLDSDGSRSPFVLYLISFSLSLSHSTSPVFNEAGVCSRSFHVLVFHDSRILQAFSSTTCATATAFPSRAFAWQFIQPHSLLTAEFAHANEISLRRLYLELCPIILEEFSTKFFKAYFFDVAIELSQVLTVVVVIVVVIVVVVVVVVVMVIASID